MKPSLKDIEWCARKHFGVKRDLKGRLHGRKTAHSRFAAFYVARKMTGRSFPAIAAHFDCDHTTVIHGYNKISLALISCPETAANLNELCAAVDLKTAKAAADQYRAVWQVIMAQPFADIGAGI